MWNKLHNVTPALEDTDEIKKSFFVKIIKIIIKDNMVQIVWSFD